MRLFTPLAFKVTLILFIRDSDGFIFNAWLRSTTEQNLPKLGQYKYQSYANSDAQAQIGGLAPASAASNANPNGYESKKDFGNPNANAAAVTPPRAFYSAPNDKDTVAAYNNQRTGISAPPKYDKPWNVPDAVVVHSIPSAAAAAAAIPSTPITYIAIPAQHYPYFYYADNAYVHTHAHAHAATAPQDQNVLGSTTTLAPAPAPQKSVQVELNYKDSMVVERMGENAVLHRKISANPTESAQTTNDSSALVSGTGTGAGASATTFAASSPVSVQRQNSTSSPAPELSASAKRNFQNRPIKLLGSSTFYTSSTNFTFTPRLYYSPAHGPGPAPASASASLPLAVPVPMSDIQYVPYTFLKSPLVAPLLYRSVPRAVSDRSGNSPPPSLPSSTAFQPTSNQSTKPICDNCIVHSNFPTNNDNPIQKPCATQESASNTSPSLAIKPSNLADFAYVFVPSQIIKHHPSPKR